MFRTFLGFAFQGIICLRAVSPPPPLSFPSWCDGWPGLAGVSGPLWKRKEGVFLTSVVCLTLFLFPPRHPHGALGLVFLRFLRLPLAHPPTAIPWAEEL